MTCWHDVARSWYELSRERTPNAKYNDAINSIRYYYTHVTAGVRQLLYPPSKWSKTGGYTAFTFVCLSVCVPVRTQFSLQQCVSLPKRISHLPQQGH